MRTRIVIAALSAALVTAIAVPLIANGARGERTKALQATLSGKNEVSVEGRKNTGDRNGLGTFSAVVDSGQLCFGITVRDIGQPVAAHIHRGGRNVAGPVVLTLTQPDAGDPGASSACIPITNRLATQILRRPSRFYANVHTGQFPNGAVRAQLKVVRR